MSLVIFTDGACSGNPGPGGWAWAVENGRFESGAEPKTTNQRMELMAVLKAVESNEGPLEIVSDSTYVVNCFRDKWHVGWMKRGWVNSKNQPVANRDIWQPLIENVLARKNVTFRWVKGHSGHRMNDLVDQLAVEAARLGRGRSSASLHLPSAPSAGLSTSSTDPAPPSPSRASARSRAASEQPTRESAAPSKEHAVGSDGTHLVVFRAKLRPTDSTEEYDATAKRMRILAFSEFGCLDFQVVTQGAYEIALSYWSSETDLVAWKRHAEHLLAQRRGQEAWYEEYSVDVARVLRSYRFPTSP